MKAIFISFNQAYYETIVNIMDRNNLKGFTYWDVVQGRGSKTGEPHSTQLRQGNGSARASGLRLEYRENYLT